MFTEYIIGWITDDLAAELRRRGRRLSFLRWGHMGQPIHVVRPAR